MELEHTRPARATASGTEVTAEAVRVLPTSPANGITSSKLTEGLLGGIAIHQTGTPFPEETAELAAQPLTPRCWARSACPSSTMRPPEKRPEKGLLGIRKALGVYANLGPSRPTARCSTPRRSRTTVSRAST